MSQIKQLGLGLLAVAFLSGTKAAIAADPAPSAQPPAAAPSAFAADSADVRIAKAYIAQINTATTIFSYSGAVRTAAQFASQTQDAGARKLIVAALVDGVDRGGNLFAVNAAMDGLALIGCVQPDSRTACSDELKKVRDNTDNRFGQSHAIQALARMDQCGGD